MQFNGYNGSAATHLWYVAGYGMSTDKYDSRPIAAKEVPSPNDSLCLWTQIPATKRVGSSQPLGHDFPTFLNQKSVLVKHKNLTNY